MVQFTAHATDSLGASSQASSSATVSGTPRQTAVNTYTLFDNNVPGTLQNDNTANELGMKFYLGNNATCTGVRFYKPVGATGTHVGSLWTTSGTLLAQGTSTNETASGWQTLTFASPVQLTAGAPYMVSYSAPANDKYYADTTGQVQHTEKSNGIIHAISAGDPTTGFSGGNGTFGTIGTFPNHGVGLGTLYGVDVVVTQNVTIYDPVGPEYYDRWPNSFPSDPTFFPIGVWLQEPLTSATQYKAMGINTYVSLWAWPPDTGQVKAIADAGMYLMAGGNDDNTTQAGPRFTITNSTAQSVLRSYHVGDEFDMSTNPHVTPDILQTYVNGIRRLDSSRPIHANFGTPTAYENAPYGGVKDVDIPKYLNTVDIISCDMYGNTMIDNKTGQVYGTWIYGHGIDRMRAYIQDQKICWGFLETSMPNTGNNNAPSPQQVYNTAWMLITHGARGIVYFVHKFWLPQDSASLLHDSTMSAMVTTINSMISSLAPVINSRTQTGLLTVQSSNTTAGPVYGVTGVPIDTMVKIYNGNTYVFSIAGRPGTTTGTFTLSGVGSATATVVGESRTIPITNGTWTDNFTEDYQPHIYQINAVAS